MNASAQLIDKDEIINTLPAKFDAVVAGIDTLKQRYHGLKIIGLEDKAGYTAVKDGIAELRTTRVAVEDVRTTFKRPLLDIGNAIDAEAKRITHELTLIEEPLKQEKKRIDDEKEAIKQAKLQEEQRKLQEEREKLAKAAREKAEAEAAAQAEQNRKLAEENARLKAEADRLAAEQKAVDDARAAEMAKLQAEKNRAEAESRALKMAAQQAEHDRLLAEQREQARLCAERERIKAEQRAEAERLEKAAQLKKDLEERIALQEALKPDFEVLAEFAATLDTLKATLNVQHPIAKDYAKLLKNDVSNLVKAIYEWIGE